MYRVTTAQARLNLRQHLHQYRHSAQLLLEFRRNALVTINAAPVAIPFLSASWRFSKGRGTTSAIEEFPRIFSRQSKVPWDTA